MTGPMIFSPEYYARMRALEEEGWWNAAMRDAAAMLLKTARLAAHGRVLDVGCGSGQTMAWFRAAHPAWDVVGLDVAFEGLNAARAFGERELLAASALDLPFADQSMDAVITLDVLQHLPLRGGDSQALSEMRRVLRPGGHLLIRTNAQSLPYAADDEAFAFHKYEVPELRTKLKHAGFRAIRVGRLNALLGLAEIPREFAARRASSGDGHYVGLLATPANRHALGWRLKRRWLQVEAAAVCRGMSWPLGRTILALAQAATP